MLKSFLKRKLKNSVEKTELDINTARALTYDPDFLASLNREEAKRFLLLLKNYDDYEIAWNVTNHPALKEIAQELDIKQSFEDVVLKVEFLVHLENNTEQLPSRKEQENEGKSLRRSL